MQPGTSDADVLADAMMQDWLEEQPHGAETA
jgi:hypothetical protein